MKPTTGYSGTPLWKKLGIKPGSIVATVDAPESYEQYLNELPHEIVRRKKLDSEVEIVHWFGSDRKKLDAFLNKARRVLSDQVYVWISWPKKSSGVPSTITEDTIRELCLPLGWVDVKVCAIDETWSGLKLVVRVELRKVT